MTRTTRAADFWRQDSDGIKPGDPGRAAGQVDLVVTSTKAKAIVSQSPSALTRIRAVKSSTLERNVFRIGDVFPL
jgi:hypothetical protein